MKEVPFLVLSGRDDWMLSTNVVFSAYFFAGGLFYT